MKKVKTITVGYEDNPVLSLAPGRLTKTQFKKAFKAEGWTGDTNDLDIAYGYFRKKGNQFTNSGIEDLKAEVYTVIYW